MLTPTYIQRIAQRAAGMQADALPASIATRLKSCLLYNLGMALAGYRHDDLSWGAIRSVYAGQGDASLWLTGEGRSPQEAAFANAALIAARGQNDTLQAAHGHIGCNVIPAVLALAQHRNASAAEVMAALAAGYETHGAIAQDAAALVVARGFRATSIFGVLGAAAGASRVLGLDAEKTAHALAIASSFAAGTMQTWADGSMEWRLQVGHASHAGVSAALFAERGVLGAPRALEGASGFYKAFAGEVPARCAKPSSPNTKPGASGTWAIDRVMFKPYPGCAINQGPVHALLGVLAAQHISTADVQRVDVWLSPAQLRYPGVASQGPFTTSAGAVMSTAFMLAAALRDRSLRQSHFTQEYADPGLLEVASRIRPQADPGLPEGGSRVRVQLRSGQQVDGACADEPGFVFSWNETVSLVQALAPELEVADGGGRLRQLIRSVDELDVAVDTSALLACLAAA